MAFRRFVSRRGQPKILYSDNGSNYRGAADELKCVLEEIPEKLREYYATLQWKFNPPGCPHMGGAWERLIQSVKKSLKAMLPTRKPSPELLHTTLTEVEVIINSRPLTYVCEEEPIALTPNHFLMGSSSGIKPVTPVNDCNEFYRENWKVQQQLIATFWKKWIAEYLPSISQRTKWFEKVIPVRKDDVVAIVDENIPNSWRLGKVTDTFTAKDGQVRQVMVKTSSGEFRRPAHRLVILIRSEEVDSPRSSQQGGECCERN